MNSKHLQLRPVRILVTVAIGLAIVLGIVTLAVPLWHEYQVWSHNGVWCYRAYPDGSSVRLYGSDCQSP